MAHRRPGRAGHPGMGPVVEPEPLPDGVVLNRAVPVADPYPVEGHEQDRSWLSAVTSPAPGRAVLKLGSVVNGHSITQVPHAETRLTVDVGTSTASFIAAYEDAVPVMPADAVDALVRRRATRTLRPSGWSWTGRSPGCWTISASTSQSHSAAVDDTA